MPSPSIPSPQLRIAICAPATPLAREDAGRVRALAAAEFPGVELAIHPQCFLEDGHFAGDDAARLAALLECAGDPTIHAVWFARGGYGSNRIAEAALAALGPAAARKLWAGYSDTGYLLAGLYRAGLGLPVHAPMPADIRRPGGAAAVRRALRFIVAACVGERGGEGLPAGLEPALAGETRPVVAFNLMTLAMLLDTPLMPDLTGHVVMVEEVSEHLYAVDRLFFHVTARLAEMRIAGLRLGRVSAVPMNAPAFGTTPEAIARDWCARRGIAFLGLADIGHDGGNRIVPFGVPGAGRMFSATLASGPAAP